MRDGTAAQPPQQQARLIAVVGPTAVGKSSLALELARRLDGEIVCADSVQIYRGCTIGSAKASEAEQAEVPHHCLDLVDPEVVYSAADFVREADSAIADIAGRGRVPIVVGGSGLYVRALLHGLSESPPADAAVRARLEALVAAHGPQVLHARLMVCDPATAERVHENDAVRIVRALEVFELTGEALSAQHGRHRFKSGRHDFAGVALTRPRAELHSRIKARAVAMLAGGFVDEVRALLEGPAGEDTQALRAIGYSAIVRYLRDHRDDTLLLHELARDTRRYARRQLVWFRSEQGFRWFRADRRDAADDIESACREFLCGASFSAGFAAEADAHL